MATIAAPKREALLIAESELSIEMDALHGKQKELRVMEVKMTVLENALRQMTEKKAYFQATVIIVEQKLERAETLIGGLGGEKERWMEIARGLEQDALNLVGDILISSSIIVYLGSYQHSFRQKYINQWAELCRVNHLTTSPDFSLIKVLGSPIEARSFVLQGFVAGYVLVAYFEGLPSDPISYENAIIMTKSNRWPLLLDPQEQAIRWIRNREKKNRLVVTRTGNIDCLRQIENGAQFGMSVLLEYIPESVDKAVLAVLSKETVMMPSATLGNSISTPHLCVGIHWVELSSQFKFFMTSRFVRCTECSRAKVVSSVAKV